MSEDQVSWSEFLWEDGVDDPTSIDVAHEGDGPILFNRAGYEAMLTSAYERISAMTVADLLRHLLWNSTRVRVSFVLEADD